MRSLIALVCSLFFVLPVSAQPLGQQEELPFGRRIAFVDVERIIDESRAIRAAMEEVDNQLAAQAAEIDRQEREFRRMQFDFERQGAMVSTEERARRREELVRREDELRRMRFELEQELNARQRQLDPLLERIYEIIADVAKREGVGMVLRGEVVIWGTGAMDLTPEVVRELDARQEEVVELFRRVESEPAAGTTQPQTDESQSSGDAPSAAPAQNEEPLPLIP